MITLIQDSKGRPVLAFSSHEKADAQCIEMNENLSPWERSDGMFYSLRDIKLEDE
jgi:hypothetical protein